MKILLFLILINIGFSSFAQNKIFDIVNFIPPRGWTETKGTSNISYSKIDGGSWAQIAIYQHSISSGNIQTDFDKEWNELIASGKTISSPEKTKPETSEGWTVMSGSGVWQYNGGNVASILTVYSNENICISVLCNTTAKPYLKDYQSLIGSLDIDTSKANNSSNQVNSSGNNTQANFTITGIWGNYALETTGYNINGRPQYTAGYLRKEYHFYPDGTYIFRNKQWLTKAPDITFVYETGSWTLKGNQLTLIPKNGKAGFWAKTNSSKEWGKLVKYTSFTLEKTTYTVEFIQDINYDNSIVLKPGKATARDGGKFNAADDPYEFHYKFRTQESLIDNPPGFKK